MFWFRKKRPTPTSETTEEHTVNKPTPGVMVTERRILANTFRIKGEAFDWARIVLSPDKYVQGMVLESLDRPGEFAAKPRVGTVHSQTISWFATLDEAVVHLETLEREHKTGGASSSW